MKMKDTEAELNRMGDGIPKDGDEQRKFIARVVTFFEFHASSKMHTLLTIFLRLKGSRSTPFLTFVSSIKKYIDNFNFF